MTPHITYGNFPIARRPRLPDPRDSTRPIWRYGESMYTVKQRLTSAGVSQISARNITRQFNAALLCNYLLTGIPNTIPCFV